MNYELSIGSLFFGLFVVIIGTILLRFHQWIADNFSGGVGSYSKFKFFALLVIITGFLVMLNIHIFILKNIINLFI